MIQHYRIMVVWFAFAMAIAGLLSGTVAADVPPDRPLTYWLPERSSPSPAAIVIAGLVLSAAVVAAGVWWSRYVASPTARLLVAGFVAAGVAAVLLLTAEIYWERIVNRYRGGNHPLPERAAPAKRAELQIELPAPETFGLAPHTPAAESVQ